MALTSAVSDFIKSIYELFASVFGTAYSLAHSLFMAIFNFVGGLLTLAGDIASGVLDIAGGVSKFVLGMSPILSLSLTHTLSLSLPFFYLPTHGIEPRGGWVFGDQLAERKI